MIKLIPTFLRSVIRVISWAIEHAVSVGVIPALFGIFGSAPASRSISTTVLCEQAVA